MSGKGDTVRPYNKGKWDKEWERIFKKKVKSNAKQSKQK